QRLDSNFVAVPGVRAAPDPQLARRAPGGAERHRPHRAALDALRLRRRRRGDAAPAPAAGEPGRPRRLHLDGRRRRHRLRAARRRRLARSRLGDRDGRRDHRLGRLAHHRDRGARAVEGVAQLHVGLVDLELQLAVERLHAHYVHALDTDQLEKWPNFFTENGRYRIATAENEARGLPLPVLYAESRAMLRDRVQSLRHANIYEPQRYRHIISSVLVENIDANHARSTASFMVIRIMENGETLLFASGRYLDRIFLPAMQY